jgi:stage III sporulation protein AG
MKKRWQKQFLFPAIAIVTGVMLILIGNRATGREEAQGGYTLQSLDAAQTERALETELEAFLEDVAGIGSVQVFLTLESSTETVYLKSEGVSGKTEYVLVSQNGKSTPIVQKQIYATVRGVAVLCTGGDLPQNQEKVIGLLSTAFHIPESRIFVAGAKKQS